MSRRKTAKYNLAIALDNVIQSPKPIFGTLAVKWKSDYFKNDSSLVLELGCGRGEYTNGLGKLFPDMNFIGVDVKGDRLAQGGRAARELELTNTAFLRIHMQVIDEHFAENEVDEIWITFPDPQIKYKRTKHRMTNTEFLQRYKKVLKKDGIIHLKTDSEFMHGYTLGLLHGEGHEVIYANHNVYRNEGSPEVVTAIQTFYEKQYLEINKAITYIQFKIK